MKKTFHLYRRAEHDWNFCSVLYGIRKKVTLFAWIKSLFKKKLCLLSVVTSNGSSKSDEYNRGKLIGLTEFSFNCVEHWNSPKQLIPTCKPNTTIYPKCLNTQLEFISYTGKKEEKLLY